jgi:hypothetical protein
MPWRERKLLARDARRDIGRELLQAIRDVKRGKYKKYQIAGKADVSKGVKDE